MTVDLTQAKNELILLTDDEYRAAAVKDLIESKAIRRNLSLKIFDWGKVEPAGGNKVRQVIGLRRGLTDELAKKITKLIRDEFPKVKSQIQGDAVRVSGKSKDDLQRVIARLRELDERRSRSSSRTTAERRDRRGPSLDRGAIADAEPTRRRPTAAEGRRRARDGRAGDRAGAETATPEPAGR